MTNDVEYLITSLGNFADTNQLIVSYNEKLCKVQRLDYYPDEEGKVEIKALNTWVEDTYSVAEFKEFLTKYGELINDIVFEAYDGTNHHILNLFESCDNSGIVFFTILSVGKRGEPLVIPNGMVYMNNNNVHTIL